LFGGGFLEQDLLLPRNHQIYKREITRSFSNVMGSGLVIFFPPTECVAFSTKKIGKILETSVFLVQTRLILLTLEKLPHF
jgi:hypothetical protein